MANIKYLRAFDIECMHKDFLSFYTFNEEGELDIKLYTRNDFLKDVRKASCFLASKCTTLEGCRVAHYMTKNAAADCILRLAAVMTGYTPVTINWQSDSLSKISFKIKVSECIAVIYDRGARNHIKKIEEDFKDQNIKFFYVDDLFSHEIEETPIKHTLHLDDEAEKMIVFTSGTTGEPKGVKLTYSNFATSFESLKNLLDIDEKTEVIYVITNPLHHVNSSVMFDWSMSLSMSVVHIFERYTTKFWYYLTELAEKANKNFSNYRLVVPLVSRHIDFLTELFENRLVSNLKLEKLKAAVQNKKVVFLMGSSPVGPSTLKALKTYIGKTPVIRFGSTETTLQVTGTPYNLDEDLIMKKLKAGLDNTYNCKKEKGYYIGNEHPKLTFVQIVKSVDIKNEHFMVPCEEGEPGYIITKGKNVFAAYVNKNVKNIEDIFYYGKPVLLSDTSIPSTNLTVCIRNGDSLSESNNNSKSNYHYNNQNKPDLPWFLGLGDIGFYLYGSSNNNINNGSSESSDTSNVANNSHSDFINVNFLEGEKHERVKDIYWQARSEHLIIKGGSNYSCEQINSELRNFLSDFYSLSYPSDFEIASIGIKYNSEHEDMCCITIELLTDLAIEKQQILLHTFIDEARKSKDVTKGSKPDIIRISKIPRNFKGAFSISKLKEEFLAYLKSS